jgi:urea transport system permease protein
MIPSLKKTGWDTLLAAGLFLFLLVIPMLTSLYQTQIFGKFIAYMIFALALDILWGSAGLMNLGFAIFFGLGGYIFGISMASQNGLPSFMLSGGLTELPLLFKPLANPAIAFFLALAVPGLVAFLLGFFVFTSKVKGVFFNIITLAFAALFELIIMNQQKFTGGSSGVNGIARGVNSLTFFGLKITIVGWYYIAFASLVAVYLFCRWLTKSRFGIVIKSIRENEARLQFLGYNPSSFKMAIFAISGVIAGFAGILYIPMTKFISVESAGLSFSTMALIWLSLGGRGNLVGAMFGALLVSVLQSTLSVTFGGAWQLALGAVMICVILFVPKGIVGTLLDLQANLARRT